MEENNNSFLDQQLSLETVQKDDSAAGDGEGCYDTAVEVPLKRKRGRPPKKLLNDSAPDPGFSSGERRGRGRPRGSGKLQQLARFGGLEAETSGGILTPYVIIAYAGEDILSKILSFVEQRGSQAVGILSAAGTVSSAFIRHTCSNALLRYEGCFQILRLSGSFKITSPRTISTISVLLANPNGGVFGGLVGGFFTAASRIQMVVGCFKLNIIKQIKLKELPESSSTETESESDLDNSEMEKFSTQIEAELERWNSVQVS